MQAAPIVGQKQDEGKVEVKKVRCHQQGWRRIKVQRQRKRTPSLKPGQLRQRNIHTLSIHQQKVKIGSPAHVGLEKRGKLPETKGVLATVLEYSLKSLS